MKRAHLPTQEQLLDLWTSTNTWAGICLMFDICSTTLARLAHKYKLPPKPRPDNSGPKNGHWKGGYGEYYGPNWEKQRKLAQERDHFTCRRCGITQEEVGKEPDVHHLQRIKSFNGDFVRANALTNLACLCAACHQFVEHNPLIPLPAQPDPNLRPTTIPHRSGYSQPVSVDPAEIVKRYVSGDSVKVSCQELGISVITYYRSLKRAGHKVTRKKLVDHTEVRRLILEEHLTRQGAADRLRINLATTYRSLPVARAA